MKQKCKIKNCSHKVYWTEKQGTGPQIDKEYCFWHSRKTKTKRKEYDKALKQAERILNASTKKSVATMLFFFSVGWVSRAFYWQYWWIPVGVSIILAGFLLTENLYD